MDGVRPRATSLSICDYTEEHSGPEAARKVALRVYEGVGSLFTVSAHLDDPDVKSGTRELVLSGLPFLAIYRVGEDIIEIARIIARSTAVALIADTCFFHIPIRQNFCHN